MFDILILSFKLLKNKLGINLFIFVVYKSSICFPQELILTIEFWILLPPRRKGVAFLPIPRLFALERREKWSISIGDRR